MVEQHGVPEPRNSEPGAQTLLRTIVGQQVSVAAARSMWAKLEAAFGSPPDLNLLLAASDEELRAAGMSRQKSGYIRSLAELVISGELDLDALPADDEEAIALLTKIKGIGRWSAEIYLLFAEGRADVLPAGDLAVHGRDRAAAGTDRRSRARSSCASSRKPGDRYRGAAAVLAWHSYNQRGALAADAVGQQASRQTSEHARAEVEAERRELVALRFAAEQVAGRRLRRRRGPAV